MSPRLRAQVEVVAEALIGGPLPTESGAGTLDQVASFVRAGWRVALAFRLAIWFVTWALPIRAGRLPPLRRVALSERAALLSAAERGPLGAVVVLLKSVVCLAWFEHPEGARFLGYDPPERLAGGSP